MDRRMGTQGESGLGIGISQAQALRAHPTLRVCSLVPALLLTAPHLGSYLEGEGQEDMAQ